MITIDEFKKKYTNKVRLLGLDLGSKKIGVSICDENQSIATPYKTLIKSTNNELVNNLKENNIPLTVCPLSNIKLCVFDKLENHNLKKMLDAGLRVMVNSDDPAYFGGYLNTNLIETSKALNLSLDEVKILIQNSFKSSFLDEKSKNIWLNKI